MLLEPGLNIKMYQGLYYLFDPVQFQEYGGNFFNGVDFYYRSIQTKKIFFKKIYIPFGPCCKTKQGFENFLKHISATRMAKVKVDLTAIFNKKESNYICDKLKEYGFKKTNYVLQDEETLLVFEEDLKLDNKKRNIINHGYKFVDIKIKNELTPKEIDEIYKIYLEASIRIKYKPKNKKVFEKLSENCLASLAYSKETKMLEGYVLCYFMDYGKTDFFEKEKNKILLNIFTGTNEGGRNHKIGHAMYYELFKKAFDEHGVDFVDLRGASRTKNRAYIHFKRDFSHNFYDLPGSFEKIYF